MNRKSKILVMMMMIITLTVGLIGCSSNKNSSTKNTNVETSKYPKTITDSYGNQVELEEEPMKVVSVAPNITEMMYALNAGDKLVARTDYCDYPEEALKLESIGTLQTPDIEKIISLEPDVVVVSTHFDEENSKKLSDLGIPVIGLYEEKDAYGVFDMITTLGDAMNKQQEAEKLVAEMKATFDDVTSKVKDLEKPSVYYVVGYGESGDFTAGGDTFIGNMIDLAGGNNIAKDVSGWSYSFESLVEADPQIIIVRNGEKDGFVAADGYQDLTAVKEGRVHEMDTNLLDRQGYRNAEGLKTLAQIFYPETFK